MKLKELAEGNERILNFFNTGPAQQAALEDFVTKVIMEVIDQAYHIEGINAILDHFGVEL